MITLTRKTDYAIIALSYMAQRPEGVYTAREIAEHFHMPLPLLMNVLKIVTQGELVRSIRGAKGGYTLAQPPEQVTLADIISTVEGPIRLVQCAARTDGSMSPCGLTATCPVTKSVRKVHYKLNDFLKQVTLAQIAYDPDYRDQLTGRRVQGVEAKTE